MTDVAERIADAIKGKPSLVSLIEEWFYSDLDIGFTLKSGNRKLRCSFESDAYYYNGVRYGGRFRRFIVWDGDDELYGEVEHFTGKLYNKDELIEFARWLEEEYCVEPA